MDIRPQPFKGLCAAPRFRLCPTPLAQISRMSGGYTLSMNSCVSPSPDRTDAVSHDCSSLTSVLLFFLLFLPRSTQEKDKNDSHRTRDKGNIGMYEA